MTPTTYQLIIGSVAAWVLFSIPVAAWFGWLCERARKRRTVPLNLRRAHLDLSAHAQRERKYIDFKV